MIAALGAAAWMSNSGRHGLADRRMETSLMPPQTLASCLQRSRKANGNMVRWSVVPSTLNGFVTGMVSPKGEWKSQPDRSVALQVLVTTTVSPEGEWKRADVQAVDHLAAHLVTGTVSPKGE